MTGKSLGDYLLIRELGQGSFGSLFLAEHRFLKRPFALKILPTEIVADSRFLERFEREVTALYQLDHPHIVKVHNVSCFENSYFLATDCILQGEEMARNLEEYLEDHPARLTEESIYHLVLQVAEALDYVHNSKISDQPLSHRSLKLTNILILEKENGPHVYLADFGLSRLLGPAWLFKKTCQTLFQCMEDADLDAADLSAMQKSFLQSFAFLAPEQKGWSQLQLSDEIKADVYAFGLIIYYIHMRALPEGFFEMPSDRFTDLAYDWDRLISSCLHTNPAKRPGHLAERVRELQQGKQVLSDTSIRSAVDSVMGTGGYHLKLNLKPQEIVRPQFEADPGAIFQTESVVMRYQPLAAAAQNLDPLMTEMAIIPGGPFFRGSNTGGRDETPRHQIILPPFAIDVHPVSNEQFVRFLEVMGGEKDRNNNDMIRLRDSRVKRSAGKLNIESGYSRHPVVGVSWYGAVAYAKWIGKRLPSEVEWEVASSGGVEEAIHPTGVNIERSQANFFSSDTTAVMSYPPNNYGIYDMAGNVYEWCHDWYDYHYYDMSVQEPDNPKGPLQGVYRVLRGGCWKSLKEDLRCAHRHRNNPGVMNGTYGFRCVADVELSRHFS